MHRLMKIDAYKTTNERCLTVHQILYVSPITLIFARYDIALYSFVAARYVSVRYIFNVDGERVKLAVSI